MGQYKTMNFSVSATDIVDGQLAAFNDGDLDGFLAYFVDDVVVLAFPSGEVMADRSGPLFRNRFRAQFDNNPGAWATLVSRVVKGRVVIDQEQVTSGEDTRTVVAIYEVGPERIERIWFVS